MKQCSPLAALLVIAAASCVSAQSADGDLTSSLRTGWQTPAGNQMAALDLRMAPGWKTYWRAPGEAGIPPTFDWSGSQNLANVVFHWPSPEVFDLNGLRSIGYHDRLVLPFEVTATDPAQPVTIRLKMDLGVCKDICLPATATFQGLLEGAGAPDAVIHAALDARPRTAVEAGLTAIGCKVTPIDDGLRLTARLDLPRFGAGDEAVVFETADPTIWVSQADASRAGSAVTATSDMVGTSGAPFVLERSGVVVTVIAGKTSVEVRGCPGL